MNKREEGTRARGGGGSVVPPDDLAWRARTVPHIHDVHMMPL